jgi:hypothetical protein
MGISVRSGGKDVQAVTLKTNPFLHPSVEPDNIEVRLRVTRFLPEDYTFHYRSLGQEDKEPLRPRFSKKGNDLYGVTFDEAIPGGSVLLMTSARQRLSTETGAPKQKNLPEYAVFIGDYREEALNVFEQAETNPMARLEIIQAYNAAFPDKKLLEQAAILEKEVYDAERAEFPNKDYQQYAERFVRGPYPDTFLDTAGLSRYTEAYTALEQALGNRNFEARQESLAKIAANKAFPEPVRKRARFLLGENRSAWDDAVFENAYAQKAYQRKQALAKYLRQFPQGINRAEAESLLAKVNKALDDVRYEKAANTRGYSNRIKALETYLEEFPKGAHRQDAREGIAETRKEWDDDLYANATRKRGVSLQGALAEYLETFPKGRHRGDAEKALTEVTREIDDRTFEKAKNEKAPERQVVAMTEYLVNFPDGAYRGHAKAYITAIGQEMETRVFEEARDQESQHERRKALQAYLAKWPAGKYRDKAERLLVKQ